MVRPRTPLMLLPAMGCDGQLWARQIVDLAAVAQVAFGLCQCRFRGKQAKPRVRVREPLIMIFERRRIRS